MDFLVTFTEKNQLKEKKMDNLIIWQVIQLKYIRVLSISSLIYDLTFRKKEYGKCRRTIIFHSRCILIYVKCFPRSSLS